VSASQRRKGAEGEREAVELLRAHGWPRAHRNFDSGSAGGGDVAHGPEGVVIEVKRHRGRLDLPSAIRQAEAAAGDPDLPVLANRRDGEPWRATLPLVDLLELLAWRERA
jgi:Holliday junction resolvase